jgi:hypothetical protein
MSHYQFPAFLDSCEERAYNHPFVNALLE